jgi:maleate cis-trans isomerase
METINKIIENLGFVSLEQFLTYVALAIIIITGLVFLDKKIKNNIKHKELEIKEKEIQECTNEIDVVEGMKVIDFLERMIKEKYNYHMYLTLLPIYIDKKIPEKKVISDLKEKIYVSVVGSLTKDVKRKILQFFTEKGIEIYIHEKIIIFMNETDFRSAEKYNEAFRDISVSNVDKILK